MGSFWVHWRPLLFLAYYFLFDYASNNLINKKRKKTPLHNQPTFSALCVEHTTRMKQQNSTILFAWQVDSIMTLQIESQRRDQGRVAMVTVNIGHRRVQIARQFWLFRTPYWDSKARRLFNQCPPSTVEILGRTRQWPSRGVHFWKPLPV